MADRAQRSGPVVIGGVGGSGTRLVAEILREIGFFIGDDLNIASDNSSFTLLFVRPKWFAESSDEEVFEGLNLFENVMMGRHPRSLAELRFLFRAAIEMTFSDTLHLGQDRGRLPLKRVARIWPMNRLATLLWSTLRVIRMFRSRGFDPSVHLGWGWKEPNSHIYIRYLAALYPDLKYVHVLRHGLDMAYSSNQAQVDNWGGHFGVDVQESPELLPRASVDYWIEANETALKIGTELLGQRFLALNFDELCLDPPRVIERLVKFLEIDDNAADTGKLASLCSVPQSLGRHRQHDLSIFSDDAISRVRELGFTVDQGA